MRQMWQRNSHRPDRESERRHQVLEEDCLLAADPVVMPDHVMRIEVPHDLLFGNDPMDDRQYPVVVPRHLGIPMEELEEQRNANIPIGRANEPEDIAEMAVFLAGPGSRNITGQAFNVDGGLVMH